MQRPHLASTTVKRATFSDEPVRSEPPSKDEGDRDAKAGWVRWLNVRGWLRDTTAFEWDILVASTCLKLLLFPA